MAIRRMKALIVTGLLFPAPALLPAQTGQYPPGQYPPGQYPQEQYPPAYPGGRAPGGINIPPINSPQEKAEA